MTGIAALAAAAAATQKITTAASPSVTTLSSPHSGVKVVTPTIVTPSGIKVTPVGNKIGKSIAWEHSFYGLFTFNMSILLLCY